VNGKIIEIIKKITSPHPYSCSCRDKKKIEKSEKKKILNKEIICEVEPQAKLRRRTVVVFKKITS